jgi:hypothetical protein
VKREGGVTSIDYDSDKGTTLFAIFRGFFWEHAKQELPEVQKSQDAGHKEQSRILEKLLFDAPKMDVVAIFSLLPLEEFPSFEDLCKSDDKTEIPVFEKASGSLLSEFGKTLAE